MALPARIKDLSQVPEHFRSEYKQSGDTFVLDVTADGNFGLHDNTGLKSALESERAIRAGLEKITKSFEGLDAEQARAAIAKMDQMKSWTPDEKTKEMIEAAKQDLVKIHGQEILKFENKNKTLQTQLEDVMLDGVAESSILAAGGSVKLLKNAIRGQLKIFEENGRLFTRVVDSKGNPRVGDSSGSYMTPAQLVDELKNDDEYSVAFKPSGAGGSGRDANNGGGSEGGKGKKVISTRQAEEGVDLDEVSSGEVVIQNS